MSHLPGALVSQDEAPLGHALQPHFTALRCYNSTRELARSALFRRLSPEIDRVLGTVVQESFAASTPAGASRLRATAWNIERGIRLQEIIRTLAENVALSGSDLLLLTELDYGMARSGNRFVAREIARELGLNYVFVPCYISLVKGSGLESRVEGENHQSLHGNALFSRYPIRRAHALSLPNGKDKMRGKEKRLGNQQAAVAVIEHPVLGPFRAVSLHLDAHSTQRHRHRQMRLVLDHLDRFEPGLPALIGGDWNTSTYNSRNAFFSIAGYCRRVLMGVNRVIRDHYPYPDRWFERHLFRELERRGFNYRDLNVPGGCTLHYHVDDLAVNENMGEWIPQWCFWWIQWALKRNAGRCSLKLDWFAGKGIRPSGKTPARIISNVHPNGEPLSDHDPITLDFTISQAG